jgi:hypothetical protein
MRFYGVKGCIASTNLKMGQNSSESMFEKVMWHAGNEDHKFDINHFRNSMYRPDKQKLNHNILDLLEIIQIVKIWARLFKL